MTAIQFAGLHKPGTRFLHYISINIYDNKYRINIKTQFSNFKLGGVQIRARDFYLPIICWIYFRRV